MNAHSRKKPKSRPALTRREREREEHRRQILKAAERVFARQGYDGATIGQIAREAEFAVGTLYKFFENKEDLYGEVMRFLARELMQSVELRVFSLPNPREAIGALIELHLRFFEEHRAFVQMVFQAHLTGRHPPVGREFISEHDRFLDSVRGVFERGIRRKIFMKGDPLYMALCLDGAVHAVAMYWSQHEPAEPFEERVRKLKAAFLERLCTKAGKP